MYIHCYDLQVSVTHGIKYDYIRKSLETTDVDIILWSVININPEYCSTHATTSL